MTIRQYCKEIGFEIIGKLKYMGVDPMGCKWWKDEAGNEFCKRVKYFKRPELGYLYGYSIIDCNGVLRGE